MVRRDKMKQWGKRAFEWLRPLVKPVLIVFGANLVGMLAILRANFSYVDDLARTAEGYKGWGNFSRYLSNFLATIMHGNGTLTDISPWPQIVAALIMAVAGVLLLYIIYGRKKFRWWELAAAVILALNPYFLECLSYKFDAPFIATAVLAMIVPFVMRGRGWLAYVLAVMLGTLATCTTYQAALGILPMVAIVLALRMWNQGEKWGRIWRFGAKTLFGYGAALIIFRLFLMQSVDTYVVTEVPGMGGLIPQVVANLQEYYQLMVRDFAPMWLGLVGVIMVGFVAMMTIESKRRKWWAAILAVLVLAVLMVICFGIYVVMVQPLFKPRAMFGVCVMVVLLAMMAVEERKWAKKWQGRVALVPIAATAVLAYLFTIFGFTYGNALALQKQWTEFRIEAVALDLEREVKEGEIVSVVGTAGFAPAIKTAIAEYPILTRLVPVEFGSSYWGQYEFSRYYGWRELEGDMFVTPNVEDFPEVEEFFYHNIRRRAGSAEVVVELK